MIDTVRRLSRDQRGGTALEYAAMGGGILLAIIIAIEFLGDRVSNSYDDTANEITSKYQAGSSAMTRP